jgi:hypothetical protein
MMSSSEAYSGNNLNFVNIERVASAQLLAVQYPPLWTSSKISSMDVIWKESLVCEREVLEFML